MVKSNVREKEEEEEVEDDDEQGERSGIENYVIGMKNENNASSDHLFHGLCQ